MKLNKRASFTTNEMEKRPSSDASEILDGFLYLGDLADAGRTQELLHLGITHILNVQDEPPVPRPEFKTKHIPLSDLGTTFLNEGIFDECFSFIGTLNECWSLLISIFRGSKEPKWQSSAPLRFRH